MMIAKKLGLAFGSLTLMSSVAFADVLVDSIKVNGAQRIESATVLSYLPFKAGDTVSQLQIDNAVKTLFQTGFFDNVQIETNQDTLTIDVDERPIVSNISFEGNDKVDIETLQKEVMLNVRDVYTPTKLNEDAKRVKSVYGRMGLNSAKIKPIVKKKSKNRVDIIFQIEEGAKNYIEDISFVGNNYFSASDLREVMVSCEKKWYRFWSSTDTYDPDRLEYDKEMLRRHYISKGFPEFKINSTDVTKDEDENFVIKFNITEGVRYRFGESKVQITLPRVDIDALGDQITTSKGSVYNANYIEESIQNISDEMGRDGYAFVEITPLFKKNDSNHTIDIVFDIKEGERIFVNEIDIMGNSRTLDKVIRRELRLNEADPFNTDKIRRSRQRIENLGYFDKVDIRTIPVVNALDKTDIAVDVSEKSTGAFNVGVGWSTYDGLLFEVGVQERNLLGTGKIVGVNASTSENETQVNLSYTDPYFLGLPMSAGFDIFHIKRDYSDDSSYEAKTVGGDLRLGWDYTERVRQTVKYTLQQDEVTNVDSTASRYIKEQEGKTNLSMIGQALSYDTRDNIFNPSEGFYSSLGFDFAGIGGDAKFVRGNLTVAKYYEMATHLVLSVSGSAGYIVGIDDDIRINHRYYLGGTTLRGFEAGGVGARDKGTGDALGGDWRVTGSTQLMFPLGLPAEFGMQGKIFVDAGVLGRPDGRYISGTIEYSNSPRVSVGTGVLWRSPMGPINIDFGFPIVKEDYDKKEVFRLSFGAGF